MERGSNLIERINADKADSKKDFSNPRKSVQSASIRVLLRFRFIQQL
jgi:hypothetical protein